MGKGDESNNSVVWNHVKIYLTIAFLAMLHYIAKAHELRTVIENNLLLHLLLLVEIESLYAVVLITLTILVGYNIARTTEGNKSLVNSFSAGFIGALSYQIIMGLFMILLILLHTEMTEDDAITEGEEGDFSIIEFLSTPIFHGILALTIAIPFQEMAPISRNRKSIQGLSKQSHSQSDVIMNHTKEIAELIESRDETQRKIREIRASLGDDLISLHHSTSEESNQLEISDAFNQLDGEEEATELELSDAFDRLDEDD
jgi:hypothetical protein